MEAFTDMHIGRYIGTSTTTDTDIADIGQYRPILNIGRYRYANPGLQYDKFVRMGPIWYYRVDVVRGVEVVRVVDLVKGVQWRSCFKVRCLIFS